jgi:uncharacterized protein
MDLPDFQVFIKPVGPACNLSCTYCYYLHKRSHHHGAGFSVMSDEMLERYINQHIQATSENVTVFSWHGGEPLLAGIDFYRKAVALQAKYSPEGKKVINGIQTNGTLINEEWCRFFAEEEFSIGISMDGPERLHNSFRRSNDGAGSFSRVMKGYDQLVVHGIDPEILCVVHAENEDYPMETYRFFRDLGVPYLTFIPLVEVISKESGLVSSRSVKPEKFGSFLCTIFDAWVCEGIGQVKIQIFEEALRTAFHQEHTLCIFKPVCGRVPVIEHNGDFYSCDHFVDTAHRVGNINTHSLHELLESPAQKVFGKAKMEKLPEYCRKCEVKQMCQGECPKNRFISTPDGEPGLNYLCEGYKTFFSHCRPFVTAVAKEVSRVE